MKRIAIFLFILAIFTPFSNADAGTLTVSEDGSGDYSSIQQAVKAAKDGDVIRVGAGTYKGGIKVKNRSIQIIGAGQDASKIVHDGNKVVSFRNVKKGGLKGFAISSAGGEAHSIVSIYNSNITIEKVTLQGKGSYYGIVAKGGSYVTLRNNVISGNYYSGILYQESKGEAEGNLVYNNGKYGIVLKEYSNPTIRNNTVSGTEKAGIWATLHSAPSIVNNIMVNSLVGVSGDQFGKPKLRHNLFFNNSQTNTEYLSDETDSIVADPLFADEENHDFSLLKGSPAIGKGEGGADIGAIPFKNGG